MLNKISFLGSGDLGSQAAFLTLQKRLAREIVLLDINADVARGRALDMEHSLGANSPAKVFGTADYADVANTDVFVITAGKALPSSGQYDRTALLADNIKIMQQVFAQGYAQSPQAIFIIVTNPVYYLATWIGRNFPIAKNKLIGFGSSLDSLRYQHYSQDPRAQVVGNHGDDMVLCGDEDNAVRERVVHAASEVIKLLGNRSTAYAPGHEIARLLEIIAADKQEVINVGKFAAGEWGLQDVVLGMPCVVGQTGIVRSDIEEISLTAAEQAQLEQSAAQITSTLNQIAI